ncbi:DUF4190 domain-containing protein [Streptomyces sp. NPDC048255]|uniref:DUF4190 domain-containing protein n=1 Tax=Streptomyces sp. NPDC048255 TaxID=3154713 RepID=UPI0033E8BBBC
MPPSPPPGPGHRWSPPSPPPAWGLPPGYGRPPALNGFALASLLVGLLCLPPLGIVFGIVALVQIAKKRERGKALAVVGLVVSVVMTGVLVLTVDRVATVVRDRFDSAGAFEDVDGELTDMEDLRTGDCFNVPGGDLMHDRPLMYTVDCAQEHHAEVSSSGPFDPAGLPGSQEAERDAEAACWKAQDAYAMDTWALPAYAEMYFYAPSRESWRRGDRQLLCVIGTTEEDQRGSLRRDAGTLTPAQVSFLKAANEVDLVLGQSPETDPASSLAEHRTWAREVYTALGAEVTALERDRAAPGMEKAAAAQLKELGAARAAWLRASQAPTPTEFDKQWDRAAAAMSVTTEQALRGAYGLSTKIPRWLEEHPGRPEVGSGRGPSSEQV